MKSGSLNLLEPSGPHRACYGTFSLPEDESRAGFQNVEFHLKKKKLDKVQRKMVISAK